MLFDAVGDIVEIAIITIFDQFQAQPIQEMVDTGHTRKATNMRTQFKQFLALAFVGTCMLVVSQTSWAQNLMTDPGFESGGTSYAPNPNPTGVPGWSVFQGAGIDPDPSAHSGFFDMAMHGAGGFNVPGAFEVFAATAGQTYTLSGWVYTPNVIPLGSNDFAILQLAWETGAPPNNYDVGANGNVGVNIGAPGTAAVQPAGSVPLPQGVWTFASVTGTAPAGTNSLGTFLLNIDADANAVFFFDDISLTLKQTLPGDYNNDGHVDAKDIGALQLALANIDLYESTYGVSNSDLTQIEALPGRGTGNLNNADLQGLINYLQAGNGSLSAVPEPSTLLLSALAFGFGLVLLRQRAGLQSHR